MFLKKKTHTAAELNCINAIRESALPVPVKCEPFTIYFDIKKLNAVRDLYGYDLYMDCLKFVSNEKENMEA